MRKVLFLFLAVPFFALGTPIVSESDLSQKLITLDAMVSKDQKEMSQGEPPSPTANVVSSLLPNGDNTGLVHVAHKQSHVMHAMGALRINVDRGDYTDAIISAQSLAIADKSPDAQSLIKDIITNLFQLRGAQEEQAARDVKIVLDRATKVVVEAKDPKELDPVLMEIGSAMDRNRFGTFTSTHLALTSQLVDADRFIKEWQNYLFDKVKDDRMAYIDDLQRIMSMSETFRPIPRSQLLEWYHEARDTKEAPLSAK